MLVGLCSVHKGGGGDDAGIVGGGFGGVVPGVPGAALGLSHAGIWVVLAPACGQICADALFEDEH
jgi:hypothetical protein